VKEGKQTFRDLRFIIFAAGLILGGAVGVWWGRTHRATLAPAAAEQAQVANESPRPVKTGSDVHTNIATAAPSPAQDDFFAQAVDAAGLKGFTERRKRLSSVLASWMRADAEGAYRFVMTQTAQVDREFAINTVLKEWARIDPQAVLAHGSDLSGRVGLSRAWKMLVEATIDVAPVETLLAVEQLPDKQLQVHLVSRLAQQWGGLEPQRALAWAKALPSGEMKGQALLGVFEGWAEKDPRSAALEASSLPSSETRKSVLEAVAWRWSEADPDAALAWFRNVPPGRDRERTWVGIENGFSRYLGKLSPTAMLAEGKRFLAMELDPNQRRDLYPNLAGMLAAKDPAVARAWVMQLPEGNDRSAALKGLLQSWSQKDPGEALRFVIANPNLDPQLGGKGVGELARKWGERDLDSALEFARTLPEHDSRQLAIYGVLEGVRDSNPSAAAALIGELPAGELRTQAASQLARQWAFTDPAGTTEWLNSLSSGTERDSAITAFVWTMDGYDIALANQWAAAIEDPKERLQSSGRVFERWLREDEASAVAWLSAQQMDAALRNHLQTQIDDRKRQ
jgi:hypothetical protein